MAKLSLSEVESLYKIRIYRESSTVYMVEVGGFESDPSMAKETSFAWSNLEEALICARGISKMFDLAVEFINLDL
jgi:hypothetical protein